MKFLITEAIVSDRYTEPKIWSIPQGAPMPAKHEDVTITISLTSSGDTRKFTDNMLRKEIMDRLKVMDATNLNKKTKDKKIGSAFVSIFDRFGAVDYNEHNTKEDAIRSLKYASDEGLIMDIAVIETKAKKMVWHQNFLGKSVCKARVDSFIKRYL